MKNERKPARHLIQLAVLSNLLCIYHIYLKLFCTGKEAKDTKKTHTATHTATHKNIAEMFKVNEKCRKRNCILGRMIRAYTVSKVKEKSYLISLQPKCKGSE